MTLSWSAWQLRAAPRLPNGSLHLMGARQASMTDINVSWYVGHTQLCGASHLQNFERRQQFNGGRTFFSSSSRDHGTASTLPTASSSELEKPVTCACQPPQYWHEACSPM